MATVEILGGDGLHRAFKELGINATRTYRGSDKPHYEVWELSKDDLKTMEFSSEWKDEFGWWRYAKGSNMGTACSFFKVNNRDLIAWDGPKREDLMNAWYDGSIEERAQYNFSFKEYEKTLCPKTYDKLTDYMCEELGVSTEKNVCALAVDLARANGLKMSELFKMYEG